MKNVLVDSAKEKRPVTVNGATQSEAELLLLRAWLEIEEWLGRSERAVSNEIKISSVELIGSGSRDDVDHRASGTS